MRILAAIPHYYAADGSRRPTADGTARSGHGRIAGRALSACIASLHQLYGPAQHIIDQATRVARTANERTAGRVDVVVCTTGDDHLLGRLTLPAGSFIHHPTDCAPPLLGFECHAVLRDRLGDYDYYAYLEDDLISRDPWLFVKLGWFTAQLGDGVLLQPNRYEVGPLGLVHKAYIDGDLARRRDGPVSGCRESLRSRPAACWARPSPFSGPRTRTRAASS